MDALGMGAAYLMENRSYCCNICNVPIRQINRHRGACLTLRAQGPLGSSHSKLEEAEFLYEGNAHFCPMCETGLREFFMKPKETA